MTSRRFKFYKTQRSRGDIIAVPEVLCEPGMEGRPMVVDYDVADNNVVEDTSFTSIQRDSIEKQLHCPADIDSIRETDVDVGSDKETSPSPRSLPLDHPPTNVRTVHEATTQRDIEYVSEENRADIHGRVPQSFLSPPRTPTPTPPKDFIPVTSNHISFEHCSKETAIATSSANSTLPFSRLDDVLNPERKQTAPSLTNERRRHRRTLSAPCPDPREISRRGISLERNNEERHSSLQSRGSNSSSSPKRNSSRGRGLVRIDSFGEVHEYQPFLLDQARTRRSESQHSQRSSRLAKTSLPRYQNLSKRASRTHGSQDEDATPQMSMEAPIDSNATSRDNVV